MLNIHVISDYLDLNSLKSRSTILNVKYNIYITFLMSIITFSPVIVDHSITILLAISDVKYYQITNILDVKYNVINIIGPSSSFLMSKIMWKISSVLLLHSWCQILRDHQLVDPSNCRQVIESLSALSRNEATSPLITIFPIAVIPIAIIPIVIIPIVIILITIFPMLPSSPLPSLSSH